jgi:uncharacterized membrane protein YkoI
MASADDNAERDTHSPSAAFGVVGRQRIQKTASYKVNAGPGFGFVIVCFSLQEHTMNTRREEIFMRKKTMLITGVAAAAVVLGGATVAVAAGTLANDDQQLSGTELQQASDAALAKAGGGTVLKAETDDGAYEVDVLRPDGTKVEVEVDRSFQATVDDRDDDSKLPALSAADRDRAANAALARVGQGTVSEVERENEGGAAYEVEVRLGDGSQVEVQVGSDFQVIGQDAPEFDDD